MGISDYIWMVYIYNRQCDLEMCDKGEHHHCGPKITGNMMIDQWILGCPIVKQSQKRYGSIHLGKLE